MLYRSTILAAILLAVVCCLIQGVLARRYEALCTADLKIDDLNESTKDCCNADLNTSVPRYVTCANMSDGQLKAFIKCCPVHDDTKDDHKGKKDGKKGGKKGGKSDRSDKSQNDKRSNGRRNNRRRDNSR